MTETSRASWNSQAGFILAAIGSAVGLGNIWRFSYITYENGGGAFLIPYFVALLTVGIPLLLLEFGLGHKKHASSSLAFAKIGRKFEWLGWWMPVVATIGINLYYSVVIGWCVNYTFLSFSLGWGNDTQDFFLNEFLQISSGVTDIGGIVPHLLVGLILVWITFWFICYKEVNHGIEKACMVFMPLLFVLTLVLIGWGLTLPGAMEGLSWYLTPDFSKLLDINVWIAAYGQIFFTLTLSFGVMIAYSSYLPKKNNLARSAYITSVSNCLFSFIAGFAIFSVVGYLAQSKGVPVDEVIKSGPTLAFIVLPEAISQLPMFNNVFGVLFFGGLVLAGLSSGISLVESFARAITDKFDFPRKVVVSWICGVSFLGSLIYTTHAGLFILDIVDHFVNQFGLVTAGLLEAIVIGWFLKASVLRKHINDVSDSSVGRSWEFFVRYLIPGILLVIIISNVFVEFEKPYGGYDVISLVILGSISIFGTILVALALSKPEWDEAKLKYNHFPEEDKLLI